jgi:hypothetical protein
MSPITVVVDYVQLTLHRKPEPDNREQRGPLLD